MKKQPVLSHLETQNALTHRAIAMLQKLQKKLAKQQNWQKKLSYAELSNEYIITLVANETLDSWESGGLRFIKEQGPEDM